LRGVGGNIVIMEEAAYINKETFLEIVVPVLSLEDACLIGLSTKDKAPSNFFNQLLKNDYFYKHEISYICEPCLAKGVRKMCKHKLDSIPHWSSEGRVEMIQQLFGEENEDRFQRENLGVVEDTGPECFSERKIQQILTVPRYGLSKPPRFVYICFDPEAGTDISEKRTSEIAIISMCGPDYILLGMEAIDAVKSEDYEDIFLSHLDRIRAIPYCEDATIVLDVESGSGFEADTVEKFVRSRFENVITVQDYQRKPGSKTTNPVKREMMELTRSAIDLDRLSIYKDFITSDPYPNKLIAKWANQMKSYARYVSVGKTLNSHNTEIFTGKGENKRSLDDLCVTTQRCIRLIEMFCHNPRYIRYHR
jgi:hypothetical protein